MKKDTLFSRIKSTFFNGFFAIFPLTATIFVLNFIYIPKYGYMAAAITTLISYAFLSILMIIFSRRLFVWEFPFKSLIKAGCASAIMGIAIISFGGRLTSSSLINLILSIFFGGILYFALLFLFREFQPKEKEVMKQFWLKLFAG